MNKGEWGKIKAFFDVRTEEGFVIKGFKLVQGINGLFVGNPSQKGNDEEYYDTIYAEKELKDELSEIAIDHYGQEVMPVDASYSNSSETDDFPKGTETETENPKTADVKGPAFTDDDIPF